MKGKFSPGTVYPFKDGKWWFSVIGPLGTEVPGDTKEYNSAHEAKEEMRKYVAKINSR